ncbi:MAG: FtsB family cell division protein [Candidatus Eremiobacter antarcticus]|nr:septum formation initiator family protein [Candidatus Eremiobacteraeota bacterium]MBC5807617.1 septum formation initiator family protein [Candidatus Eremiobacteraeota bacterium]
MTARRGSLSFKIVRFARSPRAQRQNLSRPWRVALRSASIAGRSLVVLAAVFIAGTFTVQIWRVGAQNMRLHDQIATTQRQNEHLRETTQRLEARIRRLHNPDYLVPLIHEQLGLAKPKEVFIEVKPAPIAPAAKGERTPLPTGE